MKDIANNDVYPGDKIKILFSDYKNQEGRIVKVIRSDNPAKIKVEFEDDAPKTTENIQRLSNFVRSFCIQEGLLDLDKEAMAKVPFINNNVSSYRLYIMVSINNGGYDRTRWIWKTTSNS